MAGEEDTPATQAAEDNERRKRIDANRQAARRRKREKKIEDDDANLGQAEDYLICMYSSSNQMKQIKKYEIEHRKMKSIQIDWVGNSEHSFEKWRNSEHMNH